MASGDCGKWWMARTNLEKTLLSFSVILLLTCVIIILVGVIHHGKKSAEQVENEVCSSNFCLEKTGSMMSMADFTVDPCEDFYEFSCGQYMRKHAVPTDAMEASVEQESVNAVRLQMKDWLESNSGNNISVYRKAKTLFNTCMVSDDSTEDPASLLAKAMEDQKMGSWAVLDDSWDKSYVRLEENLASLTLLGIPVVFQMEVVPDTKNEGKYITKLSPGKPFLDVNESSHILESDIFMQFVETTLLLLGVSKHLTNSKLNEILPTESKMTKFREDANAECGDMNNLFSRDLHTIRMENVTEMDTKLYSNVEWSKLLSEVLSVLNSSATKDFQFDMYCKRHIREFNDYFYHSSYKSANIYFGWRFFSSVMEFLSPKFRQLHTYYKQYISNAEKTILLQYPRWKECFSLVEKAMLPVVASAYTEQSISDSLLKEKMKIAEAVRSKWDNMLTSAKWLSSSEKEWIKQKVKESKFEVAISRMLPDVERLEEMFADLSLENDHILYNVLRYRRFKVKKELKRLLSPEEQPLQWDYKSLTSTDELHSIENRIAVHYDKLRAPYLSLEQQRYLNYGAFGTYLSRQLNRYLVSLGMKTKKSNDTMWDIFLRNRKVDECDIHSVDHQLTAKNRIINTENQVDLLSELSAVKTAYECYKAEDDEDDVLPGFKLKKKQLFFLSYAQTRCEVLQKSDNRNKVPARLSVNFALSNFDSFSNAFSCKKDSAMNLAKKCQVWD